MESIHIRDCEACESALCDYLDGTLGQAERAEVAAHLSQCAACAAYESDIREAMGLLQAAEPIEPSPILVNKILFQIPAKASGWRGSLSGSLSGWLPGWLSGRLYGVLHTRFFEPVLQPRVAMGAMMTVLSLAMMTRCAGVPNRSLSPSDLDPVKIWVSFDDKTHRTWDRTVKAYESMRLVYEVRSRVKEWRLQQEEQDATAAESAAQDALKSKALSGHKAVSAQQPGSQLTTSAPSKGDQK